MERQISSPSGYMALHLEGDTSEEAGMRPIDPRNLGVRRSRVPALLVLVLAAVSVTAFGAQTWTRDAANPIITEPGSFQPEVVVVAGTYHMYYTDRSVIPEIVRHRTSADGLAWSASTVVLQSGASGSWDDDGVVVSSVLVEGGIFKMWYTGRSVAGPFGQIGYATSPDGAIWTKHAGNPVMSVGTVGQWDSARVREASVIHLGSTYHMWYAGTLSHPIYHIGYATSPDGLAWTRNAANPVLGLGAANAWDDATVYGPQVVHYGGTFHMWYSAGDGPATNTAWQIGYASSCDLDGVNWVKEPDNPVLTLGANPSWECGDSVDYNTVFRDGTSWVMWYSGVSARCGGTDYRLGRATLVGSLPPGSACQADISVVKTVDFPTRVLGEDVIFTITVNNLGGNCASDVQVTDLLPAGLTYQSDDAGGSYVPATGIWTIGSLDAGLSATLHITARATTDGVWLNRAQITLAVPTDPVPGNNSSEVTVTVFAPTPTPTPTFTPTSTPTATATPTFTATPTPTSTPTVTPTVTVTPPAPTPPLPIPTTSSSGLAVLIAGLLLLGVLLLWRR